MENWAYIENGEIKNFYYSLPTNWESNSFSYVGFHLSENDLPWLKEKGWYPVVNQTVEFDEKISFVKEFVYEIKEDFVLKSPIIENYSQEQLEGKKHTRLAILLQDIRSLRDEKLKESDWTQAIDVQESLSETAKEAWKIYRQQLRDFPSTITLDTVDNSIIWPDKPPKESFSWH